MKRALIALGLSGALTVGLAGSATGNLVAYYPFDGNTNDTAGGFNGTVNGTTTYTTGQSGQGFSFNGSTSISTTTVDNLGLYNHSFTVAGFVKFTDPTAGDRAFFGTNAGNAGTSLEMHLIERSDKPLMGFYSNDTGGNAILAANTFYHLAFVYDATAQTQTIYVNGAQDVTQGGHGPFLGTGRTALIGSACCSSALTGVIDELRIYDNALTPTEVSALAAVPEPTTLSAIGLAGLAIFARRRPV